MHERGDHTRPRVSIVVTNCYDSPFLVRTLQSCHEQTVTPAEVVLINCNTNQDTRHIAGLFPQIVIHQQLETDRSAAQVSGLAMVSSEYVIFLNSDERLTPSAIEAGLKCFNRNPNAWIVQGGHRVIDSKGRPASPIWRELPRQEQLDKLSRGECAFALQAAVMYRANFLLLVKGFAKDAELGRDKELISAIEHGAGIATHDCCVAEYLPEQRLMLGRSTVGLQEAESRSGTGGGRRVGAGLLFHHNAPQVFAAAATDIMANGWNAHTATTMFRAAMMSPMRLLKAIGLRAAEAVVRSLPRPLGRLLGETWAPRPGSVRFGDFGRTTPISEVDGSDRGKPIDRYYIEGALSDYSGLVCGRVLEIGGRDYTQTFGGDKVARSEVLDIDALNPNATIVGDLGVVGSLPEEAFDCIIVSQTLQYIYPLESALKNLRRALAPGGALLVTVPGISPIGKGEAQKWYWEFTELSLKTPLGKIFGESMVRVQSYGNVFAAVCFLSGLSLEEVGTERLECRDERYPVIVFACARKEK
jgi:SAM-dependent methyltransferase